MNLGAILTRVLDEIGSLQTPTFFIGADDDTAKQLVAFAAKVGEEMVRDYDWQEMIQEATFTSVADVNTYDLPSDYDRIVSDTTWNRTSTRRRVYGNTTARQWNAIKAYGFTSSVAYNFRLIAGQIQLQPTPAAGLTFAYEYLSKAYCTDSGGTARTDGWVADTDIPALPADLFIAGVRYYFSKANNLPYGDAEAEYDAIIMSRTQKNTPSQAVNMSANVCRPGRRRVGRVNIPDVIPTV